MCTFDKAIKIIEVKVDVQKGPLRFIEKLTIDVLVSSNSCYHSLNCHMVIFLNDYHVHFLA